jgi:hypothetical protein
MQPACPVTPPIFLPWSRHEGRAGRIRVDIDSEGATIVLARADEVIE